MAWEHGADYAEQDGPFHIKVHFRVSHPTLTTAAAITAYIDTVLLELLQTNMRGQLARNFANNPTPYVNAKLKAAREDLPNNPGTFWIYPKIWIGGNLKQNKDGDTVVAEYAADILSFGQTRLENDGFTVHDSDTSI